MLLPPHWQETEPPWEAARGHMRCFVTKYLTVLVTEEKHPQDGFYWRHVSVSRLDRIPNWEELTEVKMIFCGAEVEAYQIFPPRSEWVNIHPRCLHLYQRIDGKNGRVLPQMSGVIEVDGVGVGRSI